MSIYDTLNINLAKLPLSESDIKRLQEVRADFQTQSLQQMFAVYKITDDGYLERGGWTWRNNVGKSQPAVRLTDAHGLIFFYTSVDNEWFEFKARFREGRLTDLIRKERTLDYQDRSCVWENEILISELTI